MRSGESIGALSLLDRRDGGSYRPADVERAMLFADLAVTALAEPGDTGPGGTRAAARNRRCRSTDVAPTNTTRKMT